jgi:CHRD domain.
MFVSVANAKDKDKVPGSLLHAKLTGFQEVPSVSTAARGEFRAIINPGDTSITYELTYQGLQNTVTQAHIHFGQRGVIGSIVIWLCNVSGNNPPPGTQTCPSSGTITGTITSADVIAASTASQLILAGELSEVIAALRAGFGYANVHSTPNTTGGEIRGQIKVVGKGDDDDDGED